MEIESFDAPSCSETAGFLFKHACAKRAGYRCDLCGKAICGGHRTVVAAATLEAQGIAHGGAPGADADACTSCASRVNRGAGAGYDDPYWYSGHYGGYGSYGPGRWGHSHLHGSSTGTVTDQNDFTEADGESLRQEGGNSYEMETSGS